MDKIKLALGASVLLLLSGQVNAAFISWTYEATINSRYSDLLGIDGEDLQISFLFDDTNEWQQVGADLYFLPELWGAEITGGHSTSLNTSMPVAKHADSCCGYMVEEIGSDSYIDLIIDGNLTLMSGNGVASSDNLIPLAGDNLLPGHLAVSTRSYTFFDFTDASGQLAQYLLSFSSINIETSDTGLCSEFPGGGATGGCFPGPGPFPGQVPEPSVIWLFGIGLVGLVGFSKRRKVA